MAAPVITLADDLKSKLETATGFTFVRRIAPYFEKSELAGGKWIIVTSGDDQQPIAREVDKSTLVIDVGYQEPLPDKTDAEPDPTENQTWFDAVMDKIETVKNQFRGSGDLRNAQYAPGTEFRFSKMTNTPIYRPDLMMDYDIFTAVVRLEFVGEIEST